MQQLHLNDGNLLIRPDELSEGNGLWHPALKEQTLSGTVILSAWDEVPAPSVVLFPYSAGQPLILNKKNYLLLDKEDILAKIETTQEELSHGS